MLEENQPSPLTSSPMSKTPTAASPCVKSPSRIKVEHENSLQKEEESLIAPNIKAEEESQMNKDSNDVKMDQTENEDENKSNTPNKQGNCLDFIQQKSQIFVFSTELANKGAEAVLDGLFQSIIAYHCDQPGTKKFLEKHPLQLSQFTRQSETQWFNKPPTVKMEKNHVPEIQEEQKTLVHPPAQAPTEHSENNNQVPTKIEMSPPPPAVSPPSEDMKRLHGVKVPYEELTPEQRQHREEQLDTLRRMEKIFFPENAQQQLMRNLYHPSPLIPPHPMMHPSQMQQYSEQYRNMMANTYSSNQLNHLYPQAAHGYPPSPYHLTPRSASAPITSQSPIPGSRSHVWDIFELFVKNYDY